jgi:AraC-like DNA-binding protein
MSRRTCYREFRASTGTTPCQLLVAQRLLLARRLLETTQLTIDEVAQQSGFGDASRLCKHFRARVRLTRPPTAEPSGTRSRPLLPQTADRPASRLKPDETCRKPIRACAGPVGKQSEHDCVSKN